MVVYRKRFEGRTGNGMLLQTNSYIVPKEKRAEHSRLIRRFRQTLLRLGCDHFEVYEQVGSNWSNSESAGRYVQILRFLDRKHQLAVQAAERTDVTAQAVIADFCDLINFPYQQQQGLFAVGFYTSVLPVAPKRGSRGELVSTVEHEVIDDPEAEKPYPGSSDGPPLEDAPMAETAEPMPMETAEDGLPIEEELPAEEGFDELAEEPMEMPAEVVAEAPVVAEVEEEITAEVVHPEPTPEIPEVKEHTHSEDDFMKLVGGELDEDLDGDDISNGFIETDFAEDIAGEPHSIEDLNDPEAEPAENHKAKDRPPGW
jgi:hypothetical protein